MLPYQFDGAAAEDNLGRDELPHWQSCVIQNPHPQPERDIYDYTIEKCSGGRPHASYRRRRLTPPVPVFREVSKFDSLA